MFPVDVSSRLALRLRLKDYSRPELSAASAAAGLREPTPSRAIFTRQLKTTSATTRTSLRPDVQTIGQKPAEDLRAFTLAIYPRQRSQQERPHPAIQVRVGLSTAKLPSPTRYSPDSPLLPAATYSPAAHSPSFDSSTSGLPREHPLEQRLRRPAADEVVQRPEKYLEPSAHYGHTGLSE